MKVRIHILPVLLIATCFSLFTACNKVPEQDLSKATAVDNSSIIAERMFNDVGKYTSGVLTDNKKSTLKSIAADVSPISSCLRVYFDFNSSPNKLVLDFGEENCFCEDGQNRRGKILITYDGGYTDSTATLNTTFDGYYVNNNQVTGNRTLSYKGYNQAKKPNWTVIVNGSVILANNGGTITYQATHNTAMVEGENTMDYKDNVFETTGSASGITPAGQAFTALVTTPLISTMKCNNFVKGVVELTPSGEPKRTLNYGEGDCDNKASLTVSGITFNVNLP